jgi:hypothetical protein
MRIYKNISDENLVVYVKAYLLYLLGTLLFCSNSFGSIQSFYLSFLELDNIYSYAWDSRDCYPQSFNGRSKQEVEI